MAAQKHTSHLELLRDDTTANAPERDISATAPEVCQLDCTLEVC